MDFWDVLRLLVPIDIPEYIRDLLSETGFDNFLAIKSLNIRNIEILDALLWVTRLCCLVLET